MSTLEETLKETTKLSGLKEFREKKIDYIKLESDGRYTVNTFEGDERITKELGESFDAVILYNRKTISEFGNNSKPLISTTSVVRESDYVKCKITGLVDTLIEFRKNYPEAKVQSVLGLVVLHPEYKKVAELVLKPTSVGFRNPNNITNHIDDCNASHKHPSLCITKFGFNTGEYQGNSYVFNTFAVGDVIPEGTKDVVKNAIEEDVKIYKLNQDALKEEYDQAEGMNRSAPVDPKDVPKPTVNPDDIPF